MPASFQNMNRKVVVSVPNFAALTPFIKGTDIISTELTLQKRSSLRDLDCAPLPFDVPEVPMYMAWHRRDEHNPAHRWLRRRIEKVAEELRSVRVL